MALFLKHPYFPFSAWKACAAAAGATFIYIRWGWTCRADRHLVERPIYSELEPPTANGYYRAPKIGLHPSLKQQTLVSLVLCEMHKLATRSHGASAVLHVRKYDRSGGAHSGTLCKHGRSSSSSRGREEQRFREFVTLVWLRPLGGYRVELLSGAGVPFILCVDALWIIDTSSLNCICLSPNVQTISMFVQ